MRDCEICRKNPPTKYWKILNVCEPCYSSLRLREVEKRIEKDRRGYKNGKN